MEGKIKLSPRLQSLISEYEHNIDQGRNIYLEDQDYHTIISYYEDELEIDRALETVEKAMQQYSFRSDFVNLKTRMLIKKGHLDIALSTIESGELVTPNQIELQLLKVNIYILQRRNEEALDLLEMMKSTCGREDLQDVYVAEAFFYESVQDHDKMFQCLKNALIINPNHQEALRLMGESVDHSRNYEESILLHKLIVDKHPYNSLAWYNLGSAYGCVGEYEKAIQALEYSFIINPMFEEGYVDCADYCRELKRYDMALDIYSEAIEVFGPDFDMLLNQAECHFALNCVDDAKRSLFEALEIDSYDDEALYLLGKCYMVNQDYNSAIKVMKKAIMIESNVEGYYHLLAKAYDKAGNPKNAAKCYKKAAESGFEIADYWEDYIIFLIEQREYDLALATAQKADEYTFSYRLMYIEACCHLLIGKKQDALRMMEEALMDSFADHTVILSMPAIISERSDILAMIDYFSKEN